MPYLDDRRRVNGWIVILTIPAIALFCLRFIESAITVDSTSVVVDVQSALRTVSTLAWLAPLFVIIQVSMIARGTAGASWQNILCAVVTGIAAVLMYRSQLGL